MTTTTSLWLVVSATCCLAIVHQHLALARLLGPRIVHYGSVQIESPLEQAGSKPFINYRHQAVQGSAARGLSSPEVELTRPRQRKSTSRRFRSGARSMRQRSRAFGMPKSSRSLARLRRYAIPRPAGYQVPGQPPCNYANQAQPQQYYGPRPPVPPYLRPQPLVPYSNYAAPAANYGAEAYKYPKQEASSYQQYGSKSQFDYSDNYGYEEPETKVTIKKKKKKKKLESKKADLIEGSLDLGKEAFKKLENGLDQAIKEKAEEKKGDNFLEKVAKDAGEQLDKGLKSVADSIEKEVAKATGDADKDIKIELDPEKPDDKVIKLEGGASLADLASTIQDKLGARGELSIEKPSSEESDPDEATIKLSGSPIGISGSIGARNSDLGEGIIAGLAKGASDMAETMSGGLLKSGATLKGAKALTEKAGELANALGGGNKAQVSVSVEPEPKLESTVSTPEGSAVEESEPAGKDELPAECRVGIQELRSGLEELGVLVEGVSDRLAADDTVSAPTREVLTQRIAKIRFNGQEARRAADLGRLKALNESARTAGLEAMRLSNSSTAKRLEPRLKEFARSLRRTYGQYRRACKGVSS